MNAHTDNLIPTVRGTEYGGGYLIDRIRVGSQLFALIGAPLALGLSPEMEWNKSYARVDGALSFNDGLANTRALADAGSELAKWALAKDIDGLKDWYIPAVDELEPRYRHFKPTTTPNYCWARSGINLNVEAPTHPYTPEEPKQTDLALFREGGAEALPPKLLWTSTQDASHSAWAWVQLMDTGNQDSCLKNTEFPALLVRRYLIR